jgi:hypothetical protein
LRLFNILDRQFELPEQKLAAFRGLSELLAPRLGQLQLLPLDLERADLRVALRHDQRLALRRIIEWALAKSFDKSLEGGAKGVVTKQSGAYLWRKSRAK